MRFSAYSSVALDMICFLQLRDNPGFKFVTHTRRCPSVLLFVALAARSLYTISPFHVIENGIDLGLRFRTERVVVTQCVR